MVPCGQIPSRLLKCTECVKNLKRDKELLQDGLKSWSPGQRPGWHAKTKIDSDKITLLESELS